MIKLLTILIFSLVVAFDATNCLAQKGFTQPPPRIAYWTFEGKDKPTVIVVHGGPGADHNYLLPEWKELTKYARVVFYDQRGSGESEAATCYSWREHANDLLTLIQAVSPTEKVFLAGSSWGVNLALLFTHHHPDKVKGLMLSGIAGWKGMGRPQEDCRALASSNATQEELKQLQASMQNDPEFKNIQPPVVKEQFTSSEKEVLDKKNIQFNEKIRDETLSSLADAPTFDQLKIRVPSIIFQGSVPCSYEDFSEVFSKKLKSKKVVRIDKSCHDPWIVDPQLFFSECGKFVERLK